MRMEVAESLDRLVRLVRDGAWYVTERRAAIGQRWYRMDQTRQRDSGIRDFLRCVGDAAAK